MINNIIRFSGSFIALVILQTLILNNIQLSGFINPYLYVLFILILPFETPKWILLIASFIIGLAVDMFSDTMGMHASASVFMGFCRPYILKVISPRDGYEFGTVPGIRHMGLKWFVSYSSILVLAHHGLLFFIEIFRFSEFFSTLFRIILSSVFTVLLILLTQYFFYNDKEREKFEF